jgi:hypothetical protein
MSPFRHAWMDAAYSGLHDHDPPTGNNPGLFVQSSAERS